MAGPTGKRGMAIRCKAHKVYATEAVRHTSLTPPQLPDMVDVVSRKCRFLYPLFPLHRFSAFTSYRFEGLHGPCYSQASYGFPGVGGKRGTAVRCRVHREPLMVNVVVVVVKFAELEVTVGAATIMVAT